MGVWNQRIFIVLGVVCVLWFCLIGFSLCHAASGTCADFAFPRNAEGQVDWPYPVKVIEQDAPLEATAASNRSSVTLDFDTTLRVTDVQGDRAEVIAADGYKPLGWVERSRLLCAITAQRGASGLERYFYIHLPSDGHSTEPLFSVAYPVSDLQDCAGQCRRLPNFSGYFVLAETEENVLLSETPVLQDASRLVGWVNRADGVFWESGVGLRPEDGTTICAYPTLQDAIRRRSTKCLKLEGGESWYRSGVRLLLLDRIQEREDVVAHVLLTLPEVSSKSNISEAYLPMTDAVAEDLWLKSDDFHKWLAFLREFEVAEEMNPPEPEALRKVFASTLLSAFENVFRHPLDQHPELPLQEHLQQEAGMPTRGDSPLFRYSLTEIMDARIVPDCEIERLMVWLQQAGQLLQIVYHGNVRPEFVEGTFPNKCASKQDIRFISGEIRSAPLGNEPDARYDRAFYNIHAYWVPKIYMP